MIDLEQPLTHRPQRIMTSSIKLQKIYNSYDDNNEVYSIINKLIYIITEY